MALNLLFLKIKMKTVINKFKKLASISIFCLPVMSYGQGMQNYSVSPNQNSYESDGILLGSLLPISQINLQKGIHLIDIEGSYSQWQGYTNPFDTMGAGSFNSKNRESLYRIRYAYPLARYTYIGLNLGFATRWEAELYDESGVVDPELFIGQHIPWRNGNFRLGLSVSPSLGPATLSRDINATTEKAKGNFYRGGFSVKPEVGFSMRANKILFGAEASYLYLGDRVRNDSLSITQDGLKDKDVQLGLNNQYLGYPQYSTQNYGAGASYFATGSENISNTISGGSIWAVKGLIEVPDWQRLGAEVIYGYVDSSTRSNSLGTRVVNSGGDFQEYRLYGRYRYGDNFSVIPLISWMPTYPLLKGQERMDSTSNAFSFQLTLRSKFEL